jgi:outer membrane protein OmpA-like peptidoglycan-associated protein
MAGLMIVFLFIAISYMRDIRSVAETWVDRKDELYHALNEEFQDDLPKWNAELDRKSLTVRFLAPEVLFDPNEATVKPEFKSILADFFPRYVAILDSYRDLIEEIRIEGHTSSEWVGAGSKANAYFLNMELSQDRTREVLEYCLSLSKVAKLRDWTQDRITANGLSSSRLILTRDGTEDRQRSRRVEFRIRTNSDERMEEILSRGLNQ